LRNGSGGGLPKADERAIAAPGDLDQQGIGLTLAGIVLEEPRTEAAGFDTHGGVDSGVIGGIAVEDVQGDGVLLERLGGVGDGVLEDVAEEKLTAVRARKDVRVEDALELGVHGTVILQRRNWDAD
jgi:hypothetical protein